MTDPTRLAAGEHRAETTGDDWVAPLPGSWLRNFRLGEWLPEPITPLFETWLLERIESSCFTGMTTAGLTTHVTVNGYYFHSPGGPRQLLRLGRQHPFKLLVNFGLVRSRPDLVDRWIIAPAARDWELVLLPQYRQLVEDGWTNLEAFSPVELLGVIDEVADAAGRYFGSITKVAGFAWKAEWALARFYRKHLSERLGGSHQVLLAGIGAAPRVAPDHAVYSLDWVRPTLGEVRVPTTGATATSTSRLAALAGAREQFELACREVLTAHRRRARAFERLLDVSRRAATRREAQVADFTLGWPFMRAVVIRLGTLGVEAGVVAAPEDVFFLTRAELTEIARGTKADHRAHVARRRLEWQRRAALTPPPHLGPAAQAERIAARWSGTRAPNDEQTEVLAVTGIPASPGRATGPARILRCADDFDSLHEGDVLVAPLTTPAWTPLFNLAAAIVIEGGTVLAHASMVAREFGLPAVVSAHAATSLLLDGELVTVDGSTGAVTRRS